MYRGRRRRAAAAEDEEEEGRVSAVDEVSLSVIMTNTEIKFHILLFTFH